MITNIMIIIEIIVIVVIMTTILLIMLTRLVGHLLFPLLHGPLQVGGAAAHRLEPALGVLQAVPVIVYC